MPANRIALRDVYRLSGVESGTQNDASAAVALLRDHDWIRVEREPTGGRDKLVYYIHRTPGG